MSDLETGRGRLWRKVRARETVLGPRSDIGKERQASPPPPPFSECAEPEPSVVGDSDSMVEHGFEDFIRSGPSLFHCERTHNHG